MYGDKSWWEKVPRKEIFNLNRRDKLEASLREFCNQKRGRLGFCSGGDHTREASELYVLMRDLKVFDE